MSCKFCVMQKFKKSFLREFIKFTFFSRNFKVCTIDAFKSKEPFKKKTRSSVTVESDSRNSSRICITIFGNGGIGQPRCIGLFTEFKGYLFNCGENVGRYCREYIVKTCLIKHVFITQRKWGNLSGLSDIYITNQTQGVYNMFLYGPPGVESLLSMLSSKVLDTQLIKKEEGYIDHTVKIDCITISLEKQISFSNLKQFFNEEPGIVYSYVCKIHEKPGDFLPENCIEKGVPLGPDLLKLKNWEDIILPSGNTVYAKDVHGPTYPERILLIVDCPSESFLNPFVHEEKFKEFQLPLQVSNPIIIFHFTPAHIFKHKDYQDWMNKFPQNTQHFILNEDNPNLGSIVVHEIEKYFRLLHPKIFAKSRENELAPIKKNSADLFNDSKCIYLPPMIQIHLRPKEELNWGNVVKDHDNINVTIDGEYIVKQSPEFYKRLNNLKSILLKKTLLNNATQKIYPEVVFLGTSSSASTSYRNVTAILVNTSPDQSILLDCGEGTMMQFVRYFGRDVYSALQKISYIFISHKHLDHYLGVFEIISQRIKAFQRAKMPYKPLIIILPNEISSIFTNFCEAFENLLPAVRLFRCKYLSVKKNAIQKFTGNLEIDIVPVKHCTDAWGIVLESVDWKIVYSGDSAPCQTLVDAGKDCTLLIHEASVEDGLLNEALAKRHSTPSQVLDIAEKMNAQYTILTHFSRRYKGFPIVPPGCGREIACAFDFMKVRRCDLPLLSHFTPVIKCLFEDHLENHQEKYSSVFSFENAFLKVLKS